MAYQKCPVCEMPARLDGIDVRGDDHNVQCVRCGRFRTSEDMKYWLSETVWEPHQVAAISYYIRSNEGLTIVRSDLEKFRSMPMPSVPTKLARLLTSMSKRHPVPGENIEGPMWSLQRLEGAVRATESNDQFDDSLLQEQSLADAAYLGEAGIANSVELHWLVYDALISQGLLMNGDVSGSVKISALGWQEVARLQEINLSSKVGFVAMSFQPEFVQLYEEALAPGIAAAGYEAKRVDRTEHNNHIDDEMIALIKRSRFLVADFTLSRGGIYFEAGYAMGLGLPVIWVVREDQKDEVHFDTRQYNHIRWTQDKLPELAKALQNRVEATIGRGPVR